MRTRFGRARTVFVPFFLRATILLSAAMPALAQDQYPSKPIHFVLAQPAGGAVDLVARALSERMSESVHQPVIVDNQPGGNGGIAGGQVARAAPDGYTLFMAVDNNLTVNPHIYPNLPYDSFRDFTPISVVTRSPLVLITNASVKANDIRELIALAKANPGKLNYASTGLGGQPHMGMELFKLRPRPKSLMFHTEGPLWQ
jgi:tripartite-type tricarboxylate transporter receptor subunit TctC